MSSGVYAWSQTAASNNTADSTINWSEGQAPSTVNDSARALMTSVAKWRDDLAGVTTSNALLTVSGTNTLTLTTNSSIQALTNGWTISFMAANTNTGAVTFAPDSLAAKHVQRISGTDLIGGEIIAGCLYTVTYHTTADVWILHNIQPTPAQQLLAYGTVSSASSLDIVLTGYTAFRAIKFVLTGFQPVTSGAVLYARTSTNGGGAYDSSAGNYGYSVLALSSGGSTTDTDTSTSATQIDITDANIGQSNTSNRPGNFEVTLLNQTSSTLYTALTWTGSYFTTVGNVVLLQGTGARLTAADVDAIRFLYSSGNISAGNYAVYGLA